MSGSEAFLRGVFASPFVLVGIAVVVKWPLVTIGIILLILATLVIAATAQGSAEVDSILERERARQTRQASEGTIGALSPPQTPPPPALTLELVMTSAKADNHPLPARRPRRRSRRA